MSDEIFIKYENYNFFELPFVFPILQHVCNFYLGELSMVEAFNTLSLQPKGQTKFTHSTPNPKATLCTKDSIKFFHKAINTIEIYNILPIY